MQPNDKHLNRSRRTGYIDAFNQQKRRTFTNHLSLFNERASPLQKGLKERNVFFSIDLSGISSEILSSFYWLNNGKRIKREEGLSCCQEGRLSERTWFAYKSGFDWSVRLVSLNFSLNLFSLKSICKQVQGYSHFMDSISSGRLPLPKTPCGHLTRLRPDYGQILIGFRFWPS